MFLLTFEGYQQTAKTLAFAKALAPQMFLRAGTQHAFKMLRVTDDNNKLVATYTRRGWLEPDMEFPNSWTKEAA